MDKSCQHSIIFVKPISLGLALVCFLCFLSFQDLDEAVLDRMDDSILFPIPGRKARAQLMVQVWFDLARLILIRTDIAFHW